MHVYILRIQGDNSDNAVCFQVLVSKERGYFHGIHNFPTDISVNCLQISSPLDEPLYMSVLRVPSINQACADRHNELQQQNSCNAQLFTFSFTQGKYLHVCIKFPFRQTLLRQTSIRVESSIALCTCLSFSHHSYSIRFELFL